jgi:Zn-dependent protease
LGVNVRDRILSFAGRGLFDLSPERLATGLTSYVVLLFSLSFHEAAHAWTAERMGDDTAARQGRITLNPLAHIDPVGTVLIPLIGIFSYGISLIGWAKPTPVGGHNFRRLAQGHVLVAGAGPASNALLALLCTLLFVLAVRAGAAAGATSPALNILVIGIQTNVVLAVFNLLPLPPLDGSWIVSWGLPRPIGERYDRVMEPMGSWLLLILFATGVLGWVLGPIVRGVVSVLFWLAAA